MNKPTRKDSNLQAIPGHHKAVMKAFSRALVREAHILSYEPGLAWQQLYNRLQWEGDDVKQALAGQLALRTLAPAGRAGGASSAGPWLRFITPYRESQAMVRT